MTAEKLYRMELTWRQIDALDDYFEFLPYFHTKHLRGIDVESLNEVQSMVHQKQNKIMEDHAGEMVDPNLEGL